MRASQLSYTENPDDIKRLERSSFVISIAAMIVAALASVGAIIYKFTGFWTVFPIFIAGLIALWLVRNGRFITGNWLIIGAIFISSVIEVLQRSGEGISRGAISMVFIGWIALAGMPRNIRGRTLLLSLLVGAVIIMIDITGPAGRLAAPQSPVRSWLTLLVVLVFSYFIAREFPFLDIRAKVTFGILGTGGVALGVLAFFALSQTGQLISKLSNQVENSVNLLAKEQLINTVFNEASSANDEFDTAISQVAGLASQLEQLQEQKNTIGNGTYWNAGVRLIKYSEGQFFNSRYSPSSVFVPSTVELDENVIRELNVTAYLDFSAPFVIENNQQITAVYFTNNRGIITYYPNNRLGEFLPHDYDGTAQPTYRVATPLFNPDRLPRWSFPRQDPAGTGLIISVSAPVYFKDEFKGVMTADFQLQRIADQISSIHIGSTGYAFLVDNDGHAIAMPAQGYELFNIQPEELEMGDEPQLTIFDGNPPFELQQITRRMVVGGNGIVQTYVGNINYFIAYAPVANNSFSLGVIVPVEELTQPVVTTRNEINSQVQVAIRSAAFILIALLAGAILVSFGLGQLIAAPVLRLTQTANQILEGDLAAQAEITARDEIGTLALAFNAMTARLRATFEGLEKNIEERTTQLVEANESNQRRAKQFQSIAQVARTISSTLDFEELLTQITTVISREFNFYHVGVFLLDTAKEYAVLSAANSEGGQVMLERGHRLKVGEKGLVGFVSSTGRPRVALDTGSDAIFFNNPDLPETRSEIALPLRAGEQIIGVLDVQSRQPSAFSQEDVAILSTLADQVTIAIQNARQNEETRKALAESEALSRQFVQSGWSQFTKKQNILGVHHTGAKATLLYAKNAGMKNEGLQVTRQLKLKGRGAVLSLPIKLRGEVIGSVDVHAPDNRPWDQDEMDIVTAIIERAAIAMENARLLVESQKRAAKERTIGEISARISAQSKMDELLKTAAVELNRNLPGTEIAIQFRKAETE